MKTILVVGGAGYVGSMLVPALLSKGYRVRVLDQFYYGYNVLPLASDQLEMICEDMVSVPDRVLEDVSCVINLGGLSNDPTANYNPEANWEMNHRAVVTLAEQCKKTGISKYIFASSCSLYDRPQVTDEMDIVLTEESKIEPVGYYAQAKYAAEQDLLMMNDKKFNVVILRKGTIYGFSHRMRFDLVVNTMLHDSLCKGRILLHGGGETWRPIIDLRDVVEAYIRVLEAPVEIVSGETFNIVGHNIRISELGLRVKNALNLHGVETEVILDYGQPSSRNYRVSGDKVKTLLGFSPNHTVENAVEEMLDKYKQKTLEELYDPRHFNIRWMKIRDEILNSTRKELVNV